LRMLLFTRNASLRKSVVYMTSHFNALPEAFRVFFCKNVIKLRLA